MPPVSEAQRRLFRWAAAHPKEARKRGIKSGVAEEMNAADKGGRLPSRIKSKAARRRG